MSVNQLIIKIYKKIKNHPNVLITFLFEGLVIVFYFPKYLHLLIKKEKIIAFDWGNGTYESFYLPLFKILTNSNLRIVFFFRFGEVNKFGLDILKRGLPRFYADLLDNKVVISAFTSKYKVMKRTVRIQIFHGFSSFGSGRQRNYIDNFDVLFLQTEFQYKQLQKDYKKIVKDKKILKIGCPKLDKLIFAKKEIRNKKSKNITLFYGPTYHCEISSVFEFLSVIVNVCIKNKYKLIVKLHPLLYYKYN